MKSVRNKSFIKRGDEGNIKKSLRCCWAWAGTTGAACCGAPPPYTKQNIISEIF